MVNLNSSSSDFNQSNENSSYSEPLIIHCDHSNTRQVIIKSDEDEKKYRPKERIREKSPYRYHHHHRFSKSKRHRSSSKLWKQTEDRLRHLYEKYSKETVSYHWKPLNFYETEALYEYAYDKYHRKSRYH